MDGSRLEVDVLGAGLADVRDVLGLEAAGVAFAEGVRVLAHGGCRVDVVLVRGSRAVLLGDGGGRVGDVLRLFVRADHGGGFGVRGRDGVVVELGGPRGLVRVDVGLAVADGHVVHVAVVLLLLRANDEGAFPPRRRFRI